MLNSGTTESEHIAQFDHKPGKCQKTCKMIVLKMTIKVLKGECRLLDHVRYFFYITNDNKKSMKDLILFYRKRADHENDIEQLKMVFLPWIIHLTLSYLAGNI